MILIPQQSPKPYDTYNAYDPLIGRWIFWNYPQFPKLINYYRNIEDWTEYYDPQRVRTFRQKLADWDENYRVHPNMYDPKDRPKSPNATLSILLPDYTTETHGDQDVSWANPFKLLQDSEKQPLLRIPPLPTFGPPSGGPLLG